jgi:acyl-CoA synthetase (NDP forming)
MGSPILAEAMRALLRPASVAIIGATPGTGRGGWIHEQLLRIGYAGPIYPVNPKYTQIRGARAYPSLADIPAPVEFVAVSLGAGQALRAIEECAQKGVRAALFVASGFAEVGPEGRAIQARLRQIALDAGIAVCGPNCYGIANLHGRFAAYGGSLTQPLRPGPIALLFQSGALTHAAMDPVAARSSGYSYVITTGNEAVVELADYITALADDPHTRVIACFVEGLTSPERFFAAARLAISRGKRLVILKTGRSVLAQRAALAHTGALTGPDAVYDALFRQLGIARVADLDELIETAELLCTPTRPSDTSTAIVSISGGSCGIAADLAQAAGLPLAQLAEPTMAQLRELLPPFATPNNPLDLTGAIGENPQLLPGALEMLCADPGVGSVALAINTPIGGDEASRGLYRVMCQQLAASAAAHRHVQHLVFSLSSGQYDPTIVEEMRAAGVPLLMGIREALLAVAHWRRSAVTLRDPALLAGPTLELPAALSTTATPLLSEQETRALLTAAALPLARELLATTSTEAVQAAAVIGFPVALKISSPAIAHKTEVGGVILNLREPAAVAQAFTTLIERVAHQRPDAHIEGVVVQEMVVGGLETLVGVTNYPDLGPVIVFGLGGIFVEAIGDWAMRAAPVDAAEARAMIAETRAAKLLAGWRGAPALDEAALVQVIVRVSQLAWHYRAQIDSIDINPLIVLPAGQGVRAVDALIVRRG